MTVQTGSIRPRSAIFDPDALAEQFENVRQARPKDSINKILSDFGINDRQYFRYLQGDHVSEGHQQAFARLFKTKEIHTLVFPAGRFRRGADQKSWIDRVVRDDKAARRILDKAGRSVFGSEPQFYSLCGFDIPEVRDSLYEYVFRQLDSMALDKVDVGLLNSLLDLYRLERRHSPEKPDVKLTKQIPEKFEQLSVFQQFIPIIRQRTFDLSMEISRGVDVIEGYVPLREQFSRIGDTHGKYDCAAQIIDFNIANGNIDIAERMLSEERKCLRNNYKINAMFKRSPHEGFTLIDMQFARSQAKLYVEKRLFRMADDIYRHVIAKYEELNVNHSSGGAWRDRAYAIIADPNGKISSAKRYLRRAIFYFNKERDFLLVAECKNRLNSLASE